MALEETLHMLYGKASGMSLSQKLMLLLSWDEPDCVMDPVCLAYTILCVHPRPKFTHLYLNCTNNALDPICLQGIAPVSVRPVFPKVGVWAVLPWAVTELERV